MPVRIHRDDRYLSQGIGKRLIDHKPLIAVVVLFPDLYLFVCPDDDVVAIDLSIRIVGVGLRGREPYADLGEDLPASDATTSPSYYVLW